MPHEKTLQDALERRNEADYQAYTLLRRLRDEHVLSEVGIRSALKNLGEVNETARREAAEIATEVEQIIEERREADAAVVQILAKERQKKGDLTRLREGLEMLIPLASRTNDRAPHGSDEDAWTGEVYHTLCRLTSEGAELLEEEDSGDSGEPVCEHRWCNRVASGHTPDGMAACEEHQAGDWNESDELEESES